MFHAALSVLLFCILIVPGATIYSVVIITEVSDEGLSLPSSPQSVGGLCVKKQTNAAFNEF